MELKRSLQYQLRVVRVVLSLIMNPRVIATGKENKGLGRRSWTRLKGKYRAVIILISGVKLLNEQHTRILPISKEPRLQVMPVFKLYIQTLQENWDLIILGIYLNDPIQRHDHKKHFRRNMFTCSDHINTFRK